MVDIVTGFSPHSIFVALVATKLATVSRIDVYVFSSTVSDEPPDSTFEIIVAIF